MRGKYEIWVLLGLALGWAIVWTLLHFSRPSAFPWPGALIGIGLAALILAGMWLDARTPASRRKDRKDKQQ